MTGEPHIEQARESEEKVDSPPIETESIPIEADKEETDTDQTEREVTHRMEIAEAETGEAVQESQDLPQEPAVVQTPRIPTPVYLSETVEPSEELKVAEDSLRTVDSSDEVGEEVSVYSYDAVEKHSEQGTPLK